MGFCFGVSMLFCFLFKFCSLLRRFWVSFALVVLGFEGLFFVSLWFSEELLGVRGRFLGGINHWSHTSATKPGSLGVAATRTLEKIKHIPQKVPS